MNKISIIIPMLNEAENITNLLNHLLQNSSKENIAEIIIVDGGSTDGSQNIVNTFFKLHSNSTNKKQYCLVETSKGRAKQMNTGAEFATGNILYFLHADSFPPNNFDKHIINQVEKNNNAGCFIMKFNSNHLWLKLAGFLTKLPWKSCRGGDQSQFITKTLFNTVGGFNEDYTIYEDNDLISRLYAKNEFVVIQKWLTTSARRYNSKGIWKLQYHFWVIHLKKWLGTSPNHLNEYYLKYVSVKK